MSAGVAARIAFAVACALIGGGWLVRSLRASGAAAGPPSRLASLLRAALLLLSGLWLLVWIAVAALRFHYPYEMEWNSGAMRDHCARLLANQPIFSPPAIEWVPYFYTPLYVQICAAVMRLAGGVSYESMRAVSIASTLGSAVLIYAWTRLLAERSHEAEEMAAAPEGSEPARSSAPVAPAAGPARLDAIWPVTAAGLYFAAYRMTGAWYDIERVDSLLLFWTLLGGFGLERALGSGRSARASLLAAGAGAALALAFLTKQQALISLIAGGAALAGNRAWRLLGAFGAAAAAVGLGGCWADSRSTGGWFWRYCFEIPVLQGGQRALALKFLLNDMLLYAPCLAMIALVAAVAAQRRPASGPERRNPARAAFLFFAPAGLLVSFSSRAHWGGYENVLIPAFVFTGMGGCIAAARLKAAHRTAELPLLLLAIAQFLALAYRPDKQVPTLQGAAAGARYTAAVREGERKGRTLSLDHGGFTRAPRLHSLSLANFSLANRPIPEAVRAGLLSGYYDTILVDMLPEPNSELAPLLLRYRPAECLQLTESWVVTGYATPNAGRRGWVLRRKQP